VHKSGFLAFPPIVVFFCLVGFPSSALAKEKPILAVMGFEEKTGKFTDHNLRPASEYLPTKLEISKVFRVVDSSRQGQALVLQRK
jgi:hypothetical protein